MINYSHVIMRIKNYFFVKNIYEQNIYEQKIILCS